MAGKSKSPRKPSDRPTFGLASEELRAICSALVDETLGWPGVTTRSMFGGIMLYREQLPFAFLPRTRKMMEEDGIWLKFQVLPAATRKQLSAEARIVDQVMQRGNPDKTGPRWVGLLVQGPSDVHHALRWLEKAHGAAR